MKRCILNKNKRYKCSNWSLLSSPKNNLNPSLLKDISEACIKINKTKINETEQQVINKMQNHHLKKHKLNTDSTSKIIKPLMTMSECKTSLEKPHSKSTMYSYKKKSLLSQLDLGVNKELNKVTHIAARVKNSVTERREAVSKVRRPSPLSDLRIYIAQNSSLTTEHSSIIKQSGLSNKIGCKKPKSICEYKDVITNLVKKSIVTRDKIQASSTKKLLKPIHIRVESKSLLDRIGENSVIQKHNSIGDIKAFENLYKKRIQLPYVRQKKKRVSVVLPFSNNEEQKQSTKSSPKKRSEVEESVKNLKRLVYLNKDRQISLVPEIKTGGRKTLLLGIHEPYFQCLEIRISD